eukprot:2569330-Pyramimonas_sp.AAC.2
MPHVCTPAVLRVHFSCPADAHQLSRVCTPACAHWLPHVCTTAVPRVHFSCPACAHQLPRVCTPAAPWCTPAIPRVHIGCPTCAHRLKHVCTPVVLRVYIGCPAYAHQLSRVQATAPGSGVYDPGCPALGGKRLLLADRPSLWYSSPEGDSTQLGKASGKLPSVGDIVARMVHAPARCVGSLFACRRQARVVIGGRPIVGVATTVVGHHGLAVEQLVLAVVPAVVVVEHGTRGAWILLHTPLPVAAEVRPSTQR